MRVTVDDKQLLRSLKDFSKRLDKSAEESLTELAQLGAKNLAQWTEPVGLTKKAKDISEKAVSKDIIKAMPEVGRTFNLIKQHSLSLAMAYHRALQEGDLDAAEGYARKALREITDVSRTARRSHLDSQRNTKGRVKDKPQILSVADRGSHESFKRDTVKRIGYVKKGWLQSGTALKMKYRPPVWLRSSEAGLGTYQRRKSGWKTSVTLINRVSYAHRLTDARKIDIALKRTYKGYVKRMEKQIEADAKKAGF